MQSKWASILDPVISSPIVNGRLQSANLIIGSTTINHLLGRKMVGWQIVDINQSVYPYRDAPLNDKTLTLASSVIATVTLWVF